MFCRKCGNELDENAKFCAKCGTSTSAEVVTQESANVEEIVEEKKIDKKVVKYTLTPTFNLGYKLCTTIFSIILCGLLVLFYLLEDMELTMYILSRYSGICLIVALVYLVIKLFFEKKQYDRLRYNFYHNKLEYVDGFIDKEEKELKYKHIREVTMSQNILERIFNIGTIKVHTSASSGLASGSRHGEMHGKNGITIHCVTDVRNKYQTIKAIIDEGTEE